MNSSKVFVFISPAAIVLVLNEELEEATEDGAGDMEGIPDDKVYPVVVILVLLLLSLLVMLRSVGKVPLAPNVPGSSGNKLRPISSSTTTSSPGSPPFSLPPPPL